MKDPEELKANHMDLSEADWRFRELALSDPRYQKRESFQVLDQPHDLLMYRLQSWPTFLGREKVAEFARISVTVSELIRSIPHRVFRDDAAAIDCFYGTGDLLLTTLLLDSPNGIDMALSRGDFIYSESGFKCIEFNLVPSLGGWETGIVSGLQLANPLIQEALETIGAEVTFANTSRVLLAHICAEIERLGIPDGPNIVFLVDPGGEKHHRQAETLRRHMQEELSAIPGKSSGRMFVCLSSALESDGPLALRISGVPVHAVVEINNLPTDRRVFRAFKAETIALFNGPLWRALSDKRNIALLSDPSVESDFTSEERSFLDRHLPWTRVVRSERTSFEGSEVFLPDLVRAERNRLVLKNAQLYGGQEVFVGRDTSAEAWNQVLDKAIQGNWVVQEFTPSRRFLYQFGEEGVLPHNVIWGPFVFGRLYAGTMLRVQPSNGTAIINLSQTAAEGVIFEGGETASLIPGNPDDV